MSSDRIVSVPCSIGELYDKYTILSIKLEKIVDPEKRTRVQDEMDHLLPIIHQLESEGESETKSESLLDHPLVFQLKMANTRLWDIEDRIRIKDQNQSFDNEFIYLARNVYINNNERFRIKNMINHQFQSALFEVKSYESL